MGTFTTRSFDEYTFSGGTFTATNTQADDDGNYVEVGGSIDNEFVANELLDPDFSASAFQWLGTLVNGGVRFHLFQDQGTGQYFLDAEADLATSGAAFPPTFTLGDLSTANFTFCFAGGTHIATPTGPVPVEDLSIGDLVMSADGKPVPVKWMGRQAVRARHGVSESLEPVRIAAGALGNGLPVRDLTVSADHGMILDGLVINASALVNGSTINFVPLSEFEDGLVYYHVETEDHDVILAEGAAAETFMDAAGRKGFDNYQEYLDLYGVERIIPEMDATRITSQRLLPDALKARLGIGAAVVEFDGALSA